MLPIMITKYPGKGTVETNDLNSEGKSGSSEGSRVLLESWKALLELGK